MATTSKYSSHFDALMAQIEKWLDKQPLLIRLSAGLVIYGGLAAIAIGGALAVVSLILSVYIYFLRDLYLFVALKPYMPWRAIAGVALVAWTLSSIKNSENKRHYGLVEAIVAIGWIALVIIGPDDALDGDSTILSEQLARLGVDTGEYISSTGLSRVLQLLGGLFLLHSGIDNYIEGRKEAIERLGGRLLRRPIRVLPVFTAKYFFLLLLRKEARVSWLETELGIANRDPPTGRKLLRLRDCAGLAASLRAGHNDDYQRRILACAEQADEAYQRMYDKLLGGGS